MYLDDYIELERILPVENGLQTIYDGMIVSRLDFSSASTVLLPDLSTDPLEDPTDRDIPENRDFPFYTFRRPVTDGEGGTIILIHGLNEKTWTKYLPWAAALCRNTGKTVVLFPIAFHMDRAPVSWSSPRSMQCLSLQRRKLYRADESSFVNAALSTRLHAAPERLFFSGLEAYSDVLALITMVRRGVIPGCPSEGRIDLFGYSIGAFLTQILLLANPEGLLSESRGVLFCGGTTLDMMNPVSRYIMDSAAAAAVHTYFTRDFPGALTKNPDMAAAAAAFPEEARVFRSMALDEPCRKEREKISQRLAGRLSAILLKNDRVMPAEAVRRTISDGKRAMGKFVRILDFPFPCDHIQPFPQTRDIAEKVDAAFRRVFALASEQLG